MRGWVAFSCGRQQTWKRLPPDQRMSQCPFNPESMCVFVSMRVWCIGCLTSMYTHTHTCWQFMTFLCSVCAQKNSYEFSPPGGPGVPGRAETHPFTHLTTHAQTEHHLRAGSLRAGPERLVKHTDTAHTHRSCPILSDENTHDLSENLVLCFPNSQFLILFLIAVFLKLQYLLFILFKVLQSWTLRS